VGLRVATHIPHVHARTLFRVQVSGIAGGDPVRDHMGHRVRTVYVLERVAGDTVGACAHHPGTVVGEDVELHHSLIVRPAVPLVRSVLLVDPHASLRHQHGRDRRHGLNTPAPSTPHINHDLHIVYTLLELHSNCIDLYSSNLLLPSPQQITSLSLILMVIRMIY